MAAVQTRSLTGKAALIAGGSKGIGAGMVRRLAAEGANVAFTFSSSDENAQLLVHEIEADGGKAMAIKQTAPPPRRLRC
jgi:3-oxoacyl-[acyl-carrier protein] reductase